MGKDSFKIRTAEETDIPQIAKLYYETVRHINSKDYSEKHIEVWSNAAFAVEGWKKKISEQYFLVAETDREIIGFSSIAIDGYLDFMYVHKEHQREGIATKLINEIEKKAAEQNNEEIYSHVSKTAKPFFEKAGYKYSGDHIDPAKEVVFINNIMKKKIK